MFLSSLAAISFWLLTLLVVVGLYKLYNYIMITFVGRAQDDIFEYLRLNFISWSFQNLLHSSSLLSSDIHVSEKQAQALANYIRANGTTILRQGRNLFLWNNLTQSILVNFLKIVFLVKWFVFLLRLFSLVSFFSSASMLVYQWMHWHLHWSV